MAEYDFVEYFKAHTYGKHEDAQIVKMDTKNLIGIYSYIPEKNNGTSSKKKYVVGFGSVLSINGRKSISCHIEEYGEYDDIEAARELAIAMRETQAEGKL